MTFLEELSVRRRFGMKPGLGAIRSACAALGDPQKRFKAIHVAGTNGKGAVCAILDAALGRTMRVGRYTSPHLLKVNERFFIDGAPVDDATLERLFSRASFLDRFPELSYFEALTAVAFMLYAEEKVDCAVLECGLGGRLDATNVCNPALCVVTRIGLDHCAWLGGTMEKIAAEKAGIIKPGVPIVLGRNEPSVRAVVEARAHELGAPFHYAPDLADESEIPSEFSLKGSYNRENAVTALAALKVFEAGLPSSAPRLAPGIPSAIIWPGRFQRIGDFVLDGAHNPPGARALVDNLKGVEDFGSFNLVAGFCGDKDVNEVLSILAPAFRRGFAVRTNNPRSLSAEETAAKMRDAGIDAVPCESVRQALGRAGRDPSVVCGSLFLVGEALAELGAYPWGKVRFDAAERLKV